MRLYNTLSGKKEEFKSIKDGEVGIYYCGMTLQEAPHVGHMRAALTSDILNRYLRYLGFKVKLVVNFTDIDDKVLLKAKEEKRDFREVTSYYEEEYRKASSALNILRPSFYPRATQHIKEIIELIEKLLNKDFGYEVDGNVFFRVRSFKPYGKLSGKKLDDLRSGARIAVDKKKKDPLDFALWKAAKPGEPYWFSPWGKGRPGWHIECSAMAIHHLGETIDIHGGGGDLMFPHHENEVAQSEAATGKKFANYWVHNAMLNIKGEKMSKSLQNFIPINELYEEFNSNTIRLYLLQAHYRKQLNYNRDMLKQASSGWEHIKVFLDRTKGLEGKPIGSYLEGFEGNMNDDLGTPGAIALAFDLVSRGNEASPDEKGAYRETLLFILDSLGFRVEEEKSIKLGEVLERILALRDSLREEGNYKMADRVRAVLLKAGIAVEDTKEGTSWRAD
ncbi:cysteine--tRNA ligase [candidate division WOR-3 bacterium]|nr:cysteine--tRNA ligase [candidate division WOR-3 bacterium]